MNFKFFDAHTHVQFAAFKDDYNEVIERALKEGVAMINVGTAKDTSAAALNLAKNYDGVYATVGLHPIHTVKSHHDTNESNDETLSERGEIFDYDFYKNLAADSKVVAIGECGLDYFRIQNQEARIKQEKAFLEQIQLAQEIRKPLMIHCRQAFGDLIKTLNSCLSILNSPPGVIHFFSGTKDDARQLLDLGFVFTFGGVITFVRDYDEVIKFIPLDRILSETDAPYVTPAPYRGKRNEPVYVIEVVKKLAEIKNVSLDKMTEQIIANTKKVFSI